MLVYLLGALPRDRETTDQRTGRCIPGQCVTEHLELLITWTMRPLDNASLEGCVPWSMHLLDDASLTGLVPERCVPALWDILILCQDRVGILQGTRRPRDAPSKGCIVHGIWNIQDFSFKDTTFEDTSSLHHTWDTFTCQWRQNELPDFSSYCLLYPP